MRGNRSRDTQPELAVRRALHARGYRYRVDIRPEPTLRRTADLVFTRARVVVLIDGCFWHGCPDHCRIPATHTDYWQAKIAGNMRRDAETTAALEARGWSVVRIWEHEDPQDAADRVEPLLTRDR
ncbi:very short patch repair endonuclease [Xylanimonas ulmi]|uniref:T/G mismatch-specific endonuclease n=2 Tax=Xylanimonas ulmi TaxID=228973 RepID=A0A4Q7M902_9MICO|nr:T/G mismatch-specific endonuclease [Xylanibacterium ulmi]